MSDIDRERAIELIELMMREYEENECMVCEITFGDEEFEALRFARDSLKVDEAYQLEYERTTKNETLVSLGAYKQVEWERDIAIQQLHELGYEFGQKIEPTTKNDCENCIHNKGVLECDMYGCKYESTTKNDLGVDCISRADINQVIEDYMDEQYHVLSDRTRERAFGANVIMARINELPSVTPIRPKGHWISHGEHCRNLGVIPSGLGAYEWCSNCDCGIDVREWHSNHYNYCPNCGSRNEVEE